MRFHHQLERITYAGCQAHSPTKDVIPVTWYSDTIDISAYMRLRVVGGQITVLLPDRVRLCLRFSLFRCDVHSLNRIEQSCFE